MKDSFFICFFLYCGLIALAVLLFLGVKKIIAAFVDAGRYKKLYEDTALEKQRVEDKLEDLQIDCYRLERRLGVKKMILSTQDLELKEIIDAQNEEIASLKKIVENLNKTIERNKKKETA